MKWGDRIEFLEKVDPQALADRPAIDTETAWYLDAFYLLSSSRSSGMAIGCIPLSEITNYGMVFGTIDEDLKTFCYVITALDSVYIKYINNSSKKGASK